jgi:hypothetical protein
MAVLFGAGAGWAAEEEEKPDYARPGVYAGVGFTRAVETFDLDAEDAGIEPGDSNALDARLGYRILPWLAGEVGFQYYDKFNLDLVGQDYAKLDGWSVTGNAKGYLLQGRIQPYGLLGAGVIQFNVNGKAPGVQFGGDDDVIDFVVRVGGGLDAYITEHLVFYFETGYMLPPIDLDDYSFITLTSGLQVRFH